MSNIYRIGVNIAMSSNGAQVLGVLSQRLLHVHAQTNQLTGGMNRLKMAIGGALGVMTGAATLKLIGHGAHIADELTKAQARAAAAGLTSQQVAEATGKAWETAARVMGTSVAENVDAISHLRAALGNLPDAYKVLEGYQRNAIALQAITGRPGEEQAYQMAQAIHLSGSANDPVTHALDAETFSRKMDLYTAMIAAGGGKLATRDLLQFQKQAGSFGGMLSDEGRINLVGVMQAMGGQRAGSTVTAVNRALLAGVMPKAVMQEWADRGLLDTSKIVSAKGGKGADSGAVAGGNVLFRNGALKGEDLFIRDPAKWVWEVLRPQLKSQGFKTTDEQINWVNKSKLGIMPTRFISELLRNEGVDRQEAENVRIAAKTDQYNAVMGRSWEANMRAFKAARDNLITAVMTPLMPHLISGMQALTRGVQGLTEWTRNNPGAAKFFGQAAIAVGVGLVALGGAAVAVAAFAALAAGGTVGIVVGGVAAIVGVVGTVIALNWKQFVAGLGVLKRGIIDAYNIAAYVLGNPIGAAGDVLTGGTGKVTKNAQRAADDREDLWNKVTGRPKTIRARDLQASLRNGLSAKDRAAYFAQPGAPPRRAAVPPGRGQQTTVQVTSVTKVDGKELARTVSTHQARAVQRAPAARHDPNATPASAAAGHSR